MTVLCGRNFKCLSDSIPAFQNYSLKVVTDPAKYLLLGFPRRMDRGQADDTVNINDLHSEVCSRNGMRVGSGGKIHFPYPKPDVNLKSTVATTIL